MTADNDAFDRAFVAIQYLLGRRSGLGEGLGRPGAAAADAAERMSRGDRHARAAELARELCPIAEALRARQLA